MQVLGRRPTGCRRRVRSAGPDGCGGCDFQHVELAGAARLKAAWSPSSSRGWPASSVTVVVEPVPGDQDGLCWRTRMQYVHLPGGDRACASTARTTWSPSTTCLIAHPDAREPDRRARSSSMVETSLGDAQLRRSPADGFWQVHPGAPRALVETVLPVPRPRGRGSGRWTSTPASACSPRSWPRLSVPRLGRRRSRATGRPPSSRSSNLSAYPRVSVVRDRVDRAALHRGVSDGADLVVLDPPRAGAKRQVVRAIAGLRPASGGVRRLRPRRARARPRLLRRVGYRLADLRAFDLFPMTHHVECVALLVPE